MKEPFKLLGVASVFAACGCGGGMTPSSVTAIGREQQPGRSTAARPVTEHQLQLGLGEQMTLPSSGVANYVPEGEALFVDVDPESTDFVLRGREPGSASLTLFHSDGTQTIYHFDISRSWSDTGDAAISVSSREHEVRLGLNEQMTLPSLGVESWRTSGEALFVDVDLESTDFVLRGREPGSASLHISYTDGTRTLYRFDISETWSEVGDAAVRLPRLELAMEVGAQTMLPNDGVANFSLAGEAVVVRVSPTTTDFVISASQQGVASLLLFHEAGGRTLYRIDVRDE